MSVVLPSFEEQNAREYSVYGQMDRHIFETEIKPRVRPEIIEEHRRRPIGKHSDDLERVLTYLRRHRWEMTGKYLLVCTKPHEEWLIGVICGDVPPQLLDETFHDRYDAEHAVFLKRLRDTGLLPGHVSRTSCTPRNSTVPSTSTTTTSTTPGGGSVSA